MDSKLEMRREDSEPLSPDFWRTVDIARATARRKVSFEGAPWAHVWASRKDGRDLVHVVFPSNLSVYTTVTEGRLTRLLHHFILNGDLGITEELPVTHADGEWRVRP